VAGTTQGSFREDTGEVDEGAGNGRDRNAVAFGRVPWVDGPGTAGPDSFNAPFGGRQHLGRRRRALEQPPQVTGGTDAQQRAVPARKYRCEVAGFDARRLMSDPVDTSMNGDEGAPLEPPPDLLRRYPLPQQCFPSHDPMGAAGDSGDQPIGVPALLSHVNT